MTFQGSGWFHPRLSWTHCFLWGFPHVLIAQHLSVISDCPELPAAFQLPAEFPCGSDTIALVCFCFLLVNNTTVNISRLMRITWEHCEVGAGIVGAQVGGGRHFFILPAWEPPESGGCQSWTQAFSALKVSGWAKGRDCRESCPEEGALELGPCRICKSLPDGQRRLGSASWTSVAGHKVGREGEGRTFKQIKGELKGGPWQGLVLERERDSGRTLLGSVGQAGAGEARPATARPAGQGRKIS